VLCEGVKKGGYSRTQQRDREEKGVPAVRRLGSCVFIESRGGLWFAESRGGPRFKDKVVACL
jgi:hypothetical protein